MAGKADIVARIADNAGLSRKQAADAYDAVVESFSDALRRGDSVKLPGFGSFSVSERTARKGRNPRTGETLTIRASKGVRFKAGKELRDALNAVRRVAKRK
ncbi:MAG TPA: HU family DNA-binding protein [Thermoanaerobaculia bacterium]|nr:HU family DNA-binding protein [Thermoanaerobaculia bacterium]